MTKLYNTNDSKIGCESILLKKNNKYYNLQNYINDLTKIKTFEQYTGAIASGNTTTLNFNNIDNENGYKPIAIVGVHCTGTRSSFINIYGWVINESNQGRIIFRNIHASNPLVSNDTKITIYILYIKE